MRMRREGDKGRARASRGSSLSLALRNVAVVGARD
jgi:hypothetical protein